MIASCRGPPGLSNLLRQRSHITEELVFGGAGVGKYERKDCSGSKAEIPFLLLHALFPSCRHSLSCMRRCR